MMLRRTLALIALLLVCAFAQAQQLAAIPELDSPVVDITGTLDAAQTQALQAQAFALQQRKGSQLQVLMVPTTQPETIEQYAVRAFEQWKLGRKGVDDGVLLVVAKDDRKMRIEVGYGLEGAIPDIAAGRVIDDYLVPKFRDGDFGGGIADGTAVLVELIDGEPLPPPRMGIVPWAAFDTGLLVGMLCGLSIGALWAVKRLSWKIALPCGLLVPGLIAAWVGHERAAIVAVMMAPLVLPAGFAAQRHRPTRYFVMALPALSLAVAILFRWRFAVWPGLLWTGVVLMCLVVVGGVFGVVVMAMVNRWKASRSGFAFRLAAMVSLILAVSYALTHAGLKQDVLLPIGIALGIVGVIAFAFVMTLDAESFKTSASARGSDRDDDRSSSSSSDSSSSSWSGGGGGSGGGGASGSW